MKRPFETIELDDDNMHWTEPSSQSLVLHPEMQLLLSNRGSLTQQLIEVSNGTFRVHTTEQAWRIVLGLSLRKLFGPVAPSHKFWSRKSVLLCNRKPVVLAHSLMPAHAAMSDLCQVLDLGEQPLGEFLFSQGGLKREAFQYAQSEQGYWGRRSIFHLDSKPIMVAEFFLPGEMLDKLRRRMR